MSNWKRVAAAATLCALFTTACAQPRERVAYSSRTDSARIRTGMLLEPLGFYPFSSIDSGSYYAQTLVYEGLVRYGANLDVVPALASSYQISEDGLTYTFKLRPDLHFSDGGPLTYDDIKASFDLARSKTSPFKLEYDCIARIEHPDQATVVLHLSRVNAPLLSRLVELRILPSRLILSQDRGKRALSRAPVGNGPFRLVRWESSLELVFEPNPFYWGEKPGYELVWRVIPDKTLMAMALMRRELDVATVDPLTWNAITNGAGTEIQLERFAGTRTIYLGLNTIKPPFNNKLVREAVCLGLNRKLIVDSVYKNFASLPKTDISPGSWAYNPDAKTWNYSPEQARATLALAGYKFIGHIWKDAQNRELSFRILTIRDYQDVAQIVSDELKKIGLPSEVQIVEYSTLRRSYLVPSRFDAILWSRSSGPDPECSLVWGTKGALNYSKFTNPRMDELMAEGLLHPQIKDRAKYYKEIQSILAEELPWVFLVQPELLVAHWSNIGNIKQARQNLTGLPWDNPLFNAAVWDINH